MRLDTASAAITVHPEAASLQARIDLLKGRLGSVLKQISLLKNVERRTFWSLCMRRALATTFGVSSDAVEITIQG
jgi:hypothetical protein